MIAFSPGVVQSCLELLAIVVRQELTFADINSSFSYFGSLSAQKVVETAQTLNWLHVGDYGYAEITPCGGRLLSAAGYEGQLRQALLDYIDVVRPSWIQNASYGRSRVVTFAGSQIAQVFVEAGLTNGTTSEVVEFWDALAARARGQHNDRLVQIGRLGERLTINYEVQRTGRNPIWVAIDNNADGYDVLSVVDLQDDKSLTIEVKASTQGAMGFAVVTRNEWEMAMESESHIFHFWNLRDVAHPELAIVSNEKLLEHMPIDCGSGQWSSSRVPFSAFSEAFHPVA